MGALLIAVVLQIMVLGTALASFAGLKTAGPQPLESAKLATPTGLVAANGGCSAGETQKTNVSATWTASAEKPDANGNAMINGYKVWRSTSSEGAYSSVGTTGIATSFTDINPFGAPTPQVFVGNGAAATVHAVNTETHAGTSITTGTIGTEPNGMAVTPEGTKVVVAEGASHQVQIITVASDTVTTTVAIPAGGSASRPDAVAIAPNGVTAYVVDGANKLVYPLTISTGTLVGTGIAVNTQGDPGAIVVTPDGKKVYVANYGSHNVSVITTASNTVTATVTIGGETGKPIALAVTPSSAHVYVADQGNAQVDDIATASDAVAKTIAVGSMADANVAAGGDPNILAITPNGSKLYVASFTGHGVEDIAIPADTLTGTITLRETEPTPNALALTPNGCQLYVHEHSHNKVDVITVSTDAVLAAAVAVGATGDPTGMSVTPDSKYVYVANTGGPSVSVIATEANTVSETLATAKIGTAPYAVLATPSQYFYKLQAGHGGWHSALTAAVTYTLGWNQGGWQ